MESKRGGFSLIVVLIVAMVGLAVMGATMQLLGYSSGSGRVTTSGNDKYNILQSGVEEAKAEIKRRMDNHNPPPKYTDKPGISDATEIDDIGVLLIQNGNVVAGRAYEKRELSGGGLLDVSIYDMQYDPELVPVDAMTKEALMRIPPSIALSGEDPWRKRGSTLAPEEENYTAYGSGSTNTGVYLIRSTLREGNEETVLDATLLQSNND